MSLVFSERLRALFAPPRYLALPLSGIALSTSGMKAVRLTEDARGLTLASYAQEWLPAGSVVDGEIVNRPAVIAALSALVRATDISAACVAVPETGSLFVAQGIIDDTLSVFDQAHIPVVAIEGESFATARALLPRGDTSTVLIIDLGKMTTKISIVAKRIPQFTTTIDGGGHALTLAVQKYFGATEIEARKIKSERGIVPEQGNEEYLAAMLSTIAVIRSEIARTLDYWQRKTSAQGTHEPIARAILVGGNASIRGLPEYLQDALHIPVMVGDVFVNLSPREAWVPSLDYTESLAYAAAIGLALRNHIKSYA